MLHLYVPSDPIDPAALQRCSSQFHGAQKALLEAQISILADFLQRTVGTTSNGTIGYLRSLIDVEPTPSSHDCIQRMDLGRVHAYWAEVHQFLQQVLSQNRIDMYLSGLRSGDSSVPLREGVIQASITAFGQRLTTMYHDFSDINGPLLLALFSMKLGLRLATAATAFDASRVAARQVASALRSVVESPSIYSAELLRKERTDHAASLSTILTSLTAIVLEIKLGGDVALYMPEISRLYDQAFGLWSIDQSKEAERALEAQSLYRKPDGALPISEAEAEEQEFLAIFPAFGDLLDAAHSSQPSDSKTSRLVETSSTLSLYVLHRELFGNPQLSLQSATQLFLSQRRLMAQTLLDTSSSPLPESLDASSLPFLFGFLNDQLVSLQRASQTEEGPYDFYFDENVPEIRKAIDLLSSLMQRLDIIISQWPEQMVLKHIKTRCEAVMQLSYRSPVAKVLSALEQLLTSVNDWEMYANRDNSLKNEQQALIALIITWRRLELSAWKDLLQKQATTFASATSEWWFRLYDASIRAILGIDHSGEDAESAVTSFLDGLVPLLEEFVTVSPLGQFHSRLSLLHSMEVYASRMIPECRESQVKPLRRVRDVLHNTRQYYAQFSCRVSTSISGQRDALEKDIRGFIKLASWKDVNIHALRQSAQKTHRHLYRVIRKFREVLRQPVAPLLVRTAMDRSFDPLRTETTQTQLLVLPATPDSLPPTQPKIGHPQHLINLSTTLHNFSTLIEQRIGPWVTSDIHHSVDSLAEDIVSTAQLLSSAQVPNDADAARKTKIQKNLLTRKKKACSDIMKELKRAGIPANVRPEVLQQQGSQRWSREQPIRTRTRRERVTIVKTDEYLYRVLGEMPDLRASLSSHHPDIPKRDLQRATLHAEGLLSLATRTRAR